MGTTQRVSINNAAALTEYFQDEQKTTTKKALSADGPVGGGRGTVQHKALNSHPETR